MTGCGLGSGSGGDGTGLTGCGLGSGGGGDGTGLASGAGLFQRQQARGQDRGACVDERVGVPC
jgi:hypothetical protein